MKQLNLNVTPQFERHLQICRKSSRINTKSEAVRPAVRQAAGRSEQPKYDFSKWLGMANNLPENKKRKFLSGDDLR